MKNPCTEADQQEAIASLTRGITPEKLARGRDRLDAILARNERVISGAATAEEKAEYEAGMKLARELDPSVLTG